MPAITTTTVALLTLTGLLFARAAGEDAESSWADIMPEGAKVEKIADGFKFVEGPIWTREGTLVFSDIPADTLYVYKGSGKPEIFLKPSNNANGHTLDKQGRIIGCEHGSRTVTRLSRRLRRRVLADKYEGKRLNSPNDAVVKSNGDIYFTDPPYGLKDEKEGKELDFNGVYRLAPDGKLTLLVKDMQRPNGIALSPDEKRLYVADSKEGIIRVFDVEADGTVSKGRLFADAKGEKPGVPDGMRVDTKGNVYCTASGGVQVFAPSGKRLGTIETPEVAANCAWGDADGKTLYITASTGLYRIQLKIPGLRP